MPQMQSRIFFGITIALVLVVNQPAESTSKICDSQKCVQLAARILDYVDPKANPCEDFYQFACGNFLKNAHGNKELNLKRRLFNQYKDELVEIYEEDIRDDDHKMVKAAKRLYQSCMDRGRDKGVGTINQTLQTFGGWPIVEGSSWVEESFDWLNTTYTLRRLGYFFEVFLSLENWEGTFRIRPDQRFYIPKLNALAEVAALLGAENEENTLKELTDVKKFSEALIDFRRATNYEENYENYTIEEIQKKEGIINWLEFVNNIAGPKVQFSKHDYFLFPLDGYLKRLINLISDTPKRVQANYMVVKMMEPILPFLIPRSIYDSASCSLQHNRADLCGGRTFDRFLDPIEVIRIRKYLSVERKKKVEEFVVNLKSKFVDLVNKVQWVPEKTKKEVIGRIEKLEIIVGFPGNYFKDEIFDMIDVDMMDVEDNATFFSLLAQATRNRQTKQYTEVKLSPYENLYRHLYHVRNQIPEYFWSSNVLYIPSTVTRDVIFDENWPEYLNYGTFGTMVLSTLSEVFFTSVSNIMRSQNDFDTKRQCWEMEMKNVTDLYGEVQKAIRMSVAEEMSYTAYVEWTKNNGEEQKLIATDYTPNQLFWILTAIPKCKVPIPRFDYINVDHSVLASSMRHNPNFSKDFNCPVNSPMNPAKRCEVL